MKNCRYEYGMIRRLNLLRKSDFLTDCSFTSNPFRMAQQFTIPYLVLVQNKHLILLTQPVSVS